MLKCAIMQPTYLSWAGYFSMIASVEKFVFLDDVQFARRSWQQRNRILFNHQEKWLTIPVLKSGKRDQLIEEVEVVDQDWKQTHFNLLIQSYKKHPYFKDIQQVFEKSIMENPSKLLSVLNISFILEVIKYLEIKTEILYSSELQSAGKKSQYLLNICEELQADIYVSAPGSLEYIEEEKYFANSNIKVEKFDFVPLPYIQYGETQFTPYLSILDLIANLGKEGAKDYLNIKKRYDESSIFNRCCVLTEYNNKK